MSNQVAGIRQDMVNTSMILVQSIFLVVKDDMSSIIWTSKIKVNPASCPLDVAPKCKHRYHTIFALVDLTGPAAFDSESECCFKITR